MPSPKSSVSAFHANSRLHFIGSWRARYESFLDARVDAHQPLRGRRPQLIAHVDMDCFFAAVAARGRDDLLDRPLAVSWGSTRTARGEISSANYLARARGVQAGMDVATALLACPELALAPYDFESYALRALEMYDVLFDISHGNVVGVSVDEAYVDITSASEERGAREVAEEIRRRVFAATGGCACSVGVGRNRLIARLATRRAKPDGAFVVAKEDEEAFVMGTRVKDVPGLGESALEKLKALPTPVESLRDVLEKVSASDVKRALGEKLGGKLLDAARGIDNTPWVVRPERKSVGAQMSWGVRCASTEVAEEFVRQLAVDVSSRMQKLSKMGASVNLKIWRALPNAAELMRGNDRYHAGFAGHGPCDVLSRSKVMLKSTNDTEAISKDALSLLRELRVAPEEIRGLGVMVNKLEDAAAAAKSPGANQPTIAQMFARGRAQESVRTALDEDLEEPWVKRRLHTRIAASDEELAETETEGDSDADADADADVDFTQSLTQNNQDWNVFHNSQDLALDEELALDDERSLRSAYQSAVRCFAWNRYELARLNISKRRRDTLSEDIHAKKTVARSVEVITSHAKRRFERGGAAGLRAFLDSARALCRAQEIIDVNADFIFAWLGAIDDIERSLT